MAKSEYSKTTVGTHPCFLILQEVSHVSDLKVRVSEKVRDLRYGENPGQTAALYGRGFIGKLQEVRKRDKDPSQTNMEDAFYAARTLRYFPDREAVRIGKHENACGFAVQVDGESGTELYRRARDYDFRSFFGGAIGLNFPLTRELAEELVRHYHEVLVAPEFEEGPLDAIGSSASKCKNLRAFRYDPADLYDIPAFIGDMFVPALKQFHDGSREISTIRADPHLTAIMTPEDMSQYLKTDRTPTPRELFDAFVALCVDVDQRSNSATFVKKGYIVGVGIGQNSRVDTVEVAIDRNRRYNNLAPSFVEQLGHDPRRLDYSLDGASMATDAFCPFPDAPLAAHEAGVRTMVVVEGGERYEDVLREMKEKGDVSYIALPPQERHFTHH
ncbi:MAG: hypothetical protein HY513_00355 [Candidatus Aenigmarchaeota archaeon]|nr:hypothetical protein [Candidatus Aenigmarchaeota archaeon]